MSSAVVLSAATRLCSFLKGRTTALEARCQLRYRCFLILVFLFSVCLLSLQGWESMDWSLVPARKRTFNFWPGTRGIKDVSMDGTVERKHGISRALVPPSMLRRCAARPASENAASAWSEIFSFLVGTRGLSGFGLIRVSPSKNHPAVYLSVLSFVSFGYQEFFCFL